MTIEMGEYVMERKSIPHYRIGDYARNMGVTPDLLKHYERKGLIQSVQAENGYRYYPFNQSVPLLECMRLRNYGVTLHEMDNLLNSADVSQVRATLDHHAARMKSRVFRDTLFLEEHEKLTRWLSRMENAPFWEILFREPMLFLPHSNGFEFLDSPDIQTLLPEWMSWMPLVKSARLSRWMESGDATGQWGFVIAEETAEGIRLPVNKAVIRIPGGRYLQYSAHLTFQNAKPAKDSFLAIRDVFQRLDVPIPDEFLQIVIMNLRIRNCQESFSIFRLRMPDNP